jgi:tetratricopeptide (TPR) repeat protein
MNSWVSTLLVFIFALAPVCVPVSVTAQKITKENLVSAGKKRTYYLYVPKSVQPSTTVPLVVLLHGSYHVGLSLAEKWQDLADREGFIILAPDSADSSKWSVPGDGPAFIHELVESLKSKYPVDPKRVYLFGHSGGAVFGLLMSLYESEYFAATAIHAGALPAESTATIELAKRKTPIQIQIGTVDKSFPLKSVRSTRDLLNAHGFAVQLIEMPGHDHWYYDLAAKINQSAWEFLQTHALSNEPRFEEHKFQPPDRKAREAIEQYNRGVERDRAGDAIAAVAAYTRAIQLDPKLADAYNNRGVNYLNQKNYAAALADFTRSIELAPSANAFNNRANILFSQDKTEEAIADFSEAIKLKPSAEAFTNRGTAYQQTNREPLAVADYERAVELNPTFGRPYVLRGLLLLKLGQDAAAWKDFDKGFQLDASLHAEFDPMIKQLRPNQ